MHGEQKLSFSNPLPVSGDFISNAKVIGCYDKGAGKGAIIEVETTINQKKDNTEICKLVSTTFARGDGGFGGAQSLQRMKYLNQKVIQIWFTKLKLSLTKL